MTVHVSVRSIAALLPLSVSLGFPGELGGRKIHVVQLESADLPPTLVSIDAETGDADRM